MLADRRADHPDRLLALPGGYRASNTKARYLPDWAFSGRIEADRLGDPDAGHHVPGRRDLDRLARARPVRAAAVEDAAAARCRSSRSIGSGCSSIREQGVATVNELVIPAGAPVHFSITSASVFNSFFIPQLGSMIYAMPGMIAQLNLQADHAGRLMGESGALQRRRLLRHELPGAQRPRRGRSQPGRRATRGRRARRSTAASYAALAAAEPTPCARTRYQRGRARACSRTSPASGWRLRPAPRPRARQRRA